MHEEQIVSKKQAIQATLEENNQNPTIISEKISILLTERELFLKNENLKEYEEFYFIVIV